MYVCSQCQKPCDVKEHHLGRSKDEAWGQITFFNEYEWRSLCHGASVTEWDEDDYLSSYVLRRCTTTINQYGSWPSYITNPIEHDRMSIQDYLQYLNDREVATLTRMQFAQEQAA